jgi:hypothetical protein
MRSPLLRHVARIVCVVTTFVKIDKVRFQVQNYIVSILTKIKSTEQILMWIHNTKFNRTPSNIFGHGRCSLHHNTFILWLLCKGSITYRPNNRGTNTYDKRNRFVILWTGNSIND